jgi:hypothetical protein
MWSGLNQDPPILKVYDLGHVRTMLGSDATAGESASAKLLKLLGQGGGASAPERIVVDSHVAVLMCIHVYGMAISIGGHFVISAAQAETAKRLNSLTGMSWCAAQLPAGVLRQIG